MAPIQILAAFDALDAVYGAAGLVVGGVGVFLLVSLLSSSSLKNAKRDATALVDSAKADAESMASERRAALEKELTEARSELKTQQDRVDKREESLDRKFDQISTREIKLDDKETRLEAMETEAKSIADGLEKQRDELKDRLAETAGLSREDAREILLEETREEVIHEAARIEQSILEEAEERARERSREITLMAIQRYAAESVAESTVRSVKIPSDDMKGRIIGREGRNIRAIERATGADILVDDTPGVISVSCFDRVRQAIAAESLQKLVADGRVHPSRVEEIVAQTKRDIEERVRQYGQDAVIEANVRGIHPKIAEAMGKLHFRTSYGQNILRHSIEVAYLSQMIADQLGLDGQIARRCGFLHDIGKAMDHEMEGGHPAIGMEFARKFGEKSEEVLNAIGGHHSDIPSTSPYTPIVMAADAISGARPGARRESMEMYIKRLEHLETIATEQPFVTEAHAIQAGREVRVILNAAQADDATAHKIARDIAKRVEDEMTFPGEIKVTVLREVRAEATAR
jgi:ribonuclease Y